MAGRPDRFSLAQSEITRAFSEGAKVLHEHEVLGVFHEKRGAWRLPKSMSATAFIAAMTNRLELETVRYEFPQRAVVGYTWGQVNPMETLLGLVDRSYYSHATALHILGLTKQPPKILYLSRERRSPIETTSEGQQAPFEQAAIDAAFSRPPRMSTNEIALADQKLRVMLLQGAHQNQLGVIEADTPYGNAPSLKLRYTGPERTLIDSVVRPFYAGGASTVLTAFKRARGQLSTKTMARMLRDMALGYPYHQALGFYLERAGYEEAALKLFEDFPMQRDFYLTHAMTKTSYHTRWRLHFPTNI